MPDTNQRKDSESAKKRFKDKYLMPDKKEHPYRLFPPDKEDTITMRKLMDSRNYIRIMTQVDDCKYIVAQYWIYCEADIWMCGDSFTLNQNPDKKIWMKYMCSASKGECICEEEISKSFLSICPNCYKVVLMIKDTTFECPHCKHKINHIDVNDAPYVKIPCQLCPKVIGWENCQALKELIQDKLKNRSHVIISKIDELKGKKDE